LPKAKYIFMKRLSFLRKLVQIFFVACMIGLIVGVPFILMVAFIPERIPNQIFDMPAIDLRTEDVLYLFIELVSTAFYVYALYLFKKTLVLFEKKKVFSFDVIKLLDQTGRAIIVGCIVATVSSFIYATLVEGTFEIDFTAGWDSAIFILGLGLFFIVLGDVFGMAKQIKEENDLTV